MDKFADETTINNSNNSKHVYKMHDSSAYTLDVVCVNSSNNNNNHNNHNNNNNEKMDDANQTTTANQKFNNTSTMHQDSIGSDFSPLTDSIQMNTDDRHNNSIELRADDEYSSHNDNQSNASDEASDNNSTDNISFVSEDIVENIILLPNNFLSDDESTNSDDVVYAYRGADFEPIQVNADVNADEETDYLEMDFEPDPASEIEPEPNQSNEPGCSHMATAAPDFIPQSVFNTMSNAMNNECGNSTLGNLNIGVHKNWLAPIDVRMNGIYKGAETSPLSSQTNQSGNTHENNTDVNIHTANNNNKLEIDTDSNEKESNTNKSLASKVNTNTVLAMSNGDAHSLYYENTVSLSTKKYTGTIPKTSKQHSRANKPKTISPDLANCNGSSRFEAHGSATAHCSLDLWSSLGNQTHKRWKIADKQKPVSSSYCDNLGDFGIGADECYTKRATVGVRSMSFPNEDLVDQKMPTAVINAVMCAPPCVENAVDQSVSVSFESTYCSIDTIVKALEKINVLPNVRVLQKALRDGENEVSRMNIPEYLVYASKRNCNYKAIINAIEQSCDDVDVEFYLNSDGSIETVNIPVRMIVNRLPANGSLTNILTIKNKRFHQMNVLGKIVNAIRRFPDMRDDLIHNELITIPQYYRSGFICIYKKQPSQNQI